jgi:XTP/dITP diphosphohydrolase
VSSAGEPVSGGALLDFLEDMRRLRRECPWKREQTHRSLARYLQEEAAETLEAIDSGDDDHLREELGDVLLQVYFHSVIAEETGTFTIDDVARGISEKMHRRNPHVFDADGSPTTRPTTLSADEVDRQWHQIKETERPRRSPYDGIAPGLPALLLATKVLEREPAAATGLPGPGDTSADLGDRLLALVVQANADGVDPEQALRDAVRRATSRAVPTEGPNRAWCQQ